MAREYWEKIRIRLKEFYKLNDTIIFTKYYQQPESECELCGHYPITHNFILLNTRSGETLTVGNECIINYKKIIVKLGVKNNVIFFPKKYKQIADNFNTQYKGTAQVIDFEFNTVRLQTLLNDYPEKISDKSLESIIDFALTLPSGYKNDLFQVAVSILIGRNEGSGEPSDEEIEEYIRLSLRREPDISEEIIDYFEGDSDAQYLPFANVDLQEDWSYSFDDMEADYWEVADFEPPDNIDLSNFTSLEKNS